MHYQDSLWLSITLVILDSMSSLPTFTPRKRIGVHLMGRKWVTTSSKMGRTFSMWKICRKRLNLCRYKTTQISTCVWAWKVNRTVSSLSNTLQMCRISRASTWILSKRLSSVLIQPNTISLKATWILMPKLWGNKVSPLYTSKTAH